jgi:predicted transcriptional regulator of viral defense system
MESLGFIKRLEKAVKTPYFTDEDLKILFHDKSQPVIHNSLSYHLKNNNIIRFRRGLYCLASSDEKFRFSKFSLANVLYSPSYNSFESSLSFYGLIPEAVYEVSSACFQKKQKKYSTPIGAFSYKYIPVRPFFLEVTRDENSSFLMARPIRALFDLVYSQKKTYKSVGAIEEDLRIDLEELEDYLQPYQASEILQLGEAYKKRTTKELSKALIKGFK